MGHRHLFNASQMFENGHDENLNHMHAVQPYDHLAMVGPSENNSLVYPVENRVHFPPPWNPTPRPNGFSSSNHNVEVAPHYQPDLSGPSHEPFRLPNGTTFSMVPENYPHHAPSTYDRQPYHGVEGGGFVDLTMGNGRGSYKRKSPGIPTVCERGSTSRYYNGATSSDLSIMQEKSNTDSQNFPWGQHISMPPSYKGDNLSIGDESCVRNVRSRPARDFESNLARTHLLSTSSHHPYSSSFPIDHSSNVSAGEWNHIPMSPAAHGRILVSDTGSSSHETNHSSARNSNTEIGRYPNDFISNRFPPMVPRNFHGSSSSQSVRGVRSNFLQRSAPSFRPSSSSSSSNSLRLGNMNSSDNGFQFVAERHPRSSSNVGWRNNDRSGRLRICNERCPSFCDEAGLHDQMTPGGLVIMDRASLFGSRNLFDQHEDMRLDIDEMGYEELLALGERIGHVSTGLSEDLISKSLRETIYCSSDQNQDEETCAICLEEYKNMDDIGMMKTCGHDYHVACIKQWLIMKNTCPICKATALAENMKIR